MDTIHPEADFSAVKEYFPAIFKKLMDNYPRKYGVYYNVNFPNIPTKEIRGVRCGVQGMGRWVREFKHWDLDAYKKYGITPEMLGQSSNPKIEEGEELYMMVGDFQDDERNSDRADHRLVAEGYVSIVPHNVDCTDNEQFEALLSKGFDTDFQ